MTELEIYNALRAGGMTAAGACGTMASMLAEGAMRGNNAQDGLADDDAYTAATNAGINNFVGDSIGYGLCQWTASSRKAKLLAYAKNIGVSIADEPMQVNFTLKEMREDFPTVWAMVSTSNDLLQCTQIVLNIYENPKVKNLGVRYQYAQGYYAKFAEADAVPFTAQATPRADLAVMLLQTVMAHDGYWEPTEIDGIKTPLFRTRVVEYAEDVAGC